MGCAWSKHDPPKRPLDLVLLGSPKSGKSTIVKQLTYEFKGGFDRQTCEGFAKDVQYNVLRMLGLVLSTGKVEIDPFLKDQSDAVIQMYHKFASEDTWSVEVLMLADHLEEKHEHVDAIVAVSKMQSLRRYVDDHLKTEPARAFLRDAEKIFRPNYVPTKDHILRVRLPEIGSHDYAFELEGGRKLSVHVVDGVRETRKDWMEKVMRCDAVVFVASMADHFPEGPAGQVSPGTGPAGQEKGKGKGRGTRFFSVSPVGAKEESQGLFAQLAVCVRRLREKGRRKTLFLLLNKTDVAHDRLAGAAAGGGGGKGAGGELLEEEIRRVDETLTRAKEEYEAVAGLGEEGDDEGKCHCRSVCSLDPGPFLQVFPGMLDLMCEELEEWAGCKPKDKAKAAKVVEAK